MLTPTELERLKKHFPHKYKTPQIHPSVYLAPGSHTMGDLVIGKESSVWFNTVIRADVSFVRIGERTNIQDCSLIHESYPSTSCTIGDGVTVGHCVILHACKIGNNTLIGMGSTILDGAEIGDFVLLGAGSLVTQGMKIPSGVKAFGRPAKVVGELTQQEKDRILWNATHYVDLAKTYL